MAVIHLLHRVVQDIADYVHDYEVTSEEAYNTARLCLMDSIGCGMEALRFPQAAAVCGPVVPGTVVPNGAKVCWLERVRQGCLKRTTQY